MRIPHYLSYSSFSLFEKNTEEFYLKFLADNRPERLPQERPASVGSAFDAYVKSSFHRALFGPGADPKYEFEALFEAQVEPHNRDWAREEGEYIFECYKIAGQYDTLLALLQKSIEPPRMEFEVRTTIEGVPMLCKPDLRFVLPGPVKITHDFKVNGYCSKSATSPNKGYMICTDGYKAADGKQSKSHGTTHKQFQPIDFHGLTIDAGALEDCSTEWADQLSLYAWALGEKPGDPETVISVDQIVAKPVPESRPLLRVASFRARVRKSYQELLLKRLKTCWEVIQSGHIFRDLSREESDQRMKLLDGQGIATSSGSEYDGFFNDVVRAKYRG
jgi:hypothetical protein